MSISFIELWMSQKYFCYKKVMAPHSSTPAWKIPWMEEPGRLQSMGSLRIRHDWAPSLSLFTFMHWRRKWQPTPVFLPGESQGRGSLVGCRLRGLTESDTTEATSSSNSSSSTHYKGQWLHGLSISSRNSEHFYFQLCAFLTGFLLWACVTLKLITLACWKYFYKYEEKYTKITCSPLTFNKYCFVLLASNFFKK